jgi:hypothetical protein
MRRFSTFLIDHSDGPIMWAWMVALIAFVLPARAGMALADWLLPLAVAPFVALVPIIGIALIRMLLGR